MYLEKVRSARDRWVIVADSLPGAPGDLLRGLVEDLGEQAPKIVFISLEFLQGWGGDPGGSQHAVFTG
jgi:hypothetical protein